MLLTGKRQQKILKINKLLSYFLNAVIVKNNGVFRLGIIVMEPGRGHARPTDCNGQLF
jgi:hypothetical protein